MNLILIFILIIFVIILFYIFYLRIYKKLKFNLFGKILGFFYKENLFSSRISKEILKKESINKTHESIKNINSGLSDKPNLLSKIREEKLQNKNKMIKKEDSNINTLIKKELPIEIPSSKEKEEIKKNLSNQEKIQILISRIKDKRLLNLVQYIKDKNFDLSNLILSNQVDQDLSTSLSNFIANYLKDRYETIKSEISSLRKKGKDVSSITLKSLSIPFKIKIFQASFDMVDFDKIIKIMESTESDISLIKKEINEDLNKDK